jgi:hypothetical protein
MQSPSFSAALPATYPAFRESANQPIHAEKVSVPLPANDLAPKQQSSQYPAKKGV